MYYLGRRSKASTIFQKIPDNFKTESGQIIGTVIWVSVTLHFDGNMNKIVSVHNILFGYKNHGYCVDGVLDKWDDGGDRRIPRVQYYRPKDGVYLMPEPIWNVIRDNVIDPNGVGFEVRDVGVRKDFVPSPKFFMLGYGARIIGQPRPTRGRNLL